MTSKPNFSKVYKKANEILVSSNLITEFPYSTKKLIKEQLGISCKKFSKAQEYNVDIEAFGSKSAVAIQDDRRRTIIFYNQDEIKERIRFSSLHEGGHILLDHDLNTKNIELYNIYEIEANCFAAQLLMPEQIVREFQKRGIRPTKEFLMEKFNVSESAAEKRLETLFKITWTRNVLESQYDDIILKKCLPWINNIAPTRIEDWYAEEERQKARNQWWNRRY